MVKSNINIYSLLFLISLVILHTGCQTYNQSAQNNYINNNADFENISSIAVLPVNVNIIKNEFTEDEKLYSLEEYFNESLSSILKKHIQLKGYSNKKLSNDCYLNDNEFNYKLFQIRKKLNASNHTLNTLGSDINYFADLYQADAILFADYYGNILSRTKRLKKLGADFVLHFGLAVAFPGYTPVGGSQLKPVEYADLELILVDGTTGDILWKNSDSHNSPEYESLRFRDILALKTIKKLPAKTRVNEQAPNKGNIYLTYPIFNSDKHSMQNYKDNCNARQVLAQSLKNKTEIKFYIDDSDIDINDARLLKLEIVEINLGSNILAKDDKSTNVTVIGTLEKNDQILASFIAKDLIFSFRLECGRLKGAIDDITDNIVDWLKEPKMGAYLGEI